MNEKIIKEDADCCNVWKEIARKFGWLQYTDQPGMSTMPYIEVGATKFFINFCPSCGKPARNRKMKTERIF